MICSRKRINFFVVISLILLTSSALFAQSARKKVKQGNQLFMQQKYETALNKYQDAALERPDSKEVQYNIGDVLYKMKKYDKALETYQKALSVEDPLLQSKIYYNMGNTLFRANKLKESIEAYKEALKLNPDDEDAKYNLEFVRNKLKENAKKQNGNQNRQQQQQQQKQPKGNNNKDQEKQEQKKQQAQQQNQAKQQQGGEKKKMTKEQAEQLLNALKEDQKKLKGKKVQTGGRVRVVKDW